MLLVASQDANLPISIRSIDDGSNLLLVNVERNILLYRDDSQRIHLSPAFVELLSCTAIEQNSMVINAVNIAFEHIGAIAMDTEEVVFRIEATNCPENNAEIVPTIQKSFHFIGKIAKSGGLS